MEKTAVGNPKIGLVDKELVGFPDKNLLQPGEVGATIELIVREGIFDAEGKITNRIGPKRSESFVQQFLQILLVQMSGIIELIPYNIIDTGGNTRACGSTSYNFKCGALAAAVTSGIIIGTGNTAPVITNYAIETIIPHATMNYSAVTFGAPASDATTSQFTITRNFANVSGGGVTVNEIALYVECDKGDTPTPFYFMTIRDVIAGGILVPNGQTLTVNYRPQAVV